MKHTIKIEGIRLYAYHGCLAEETRVGGQYIVNINLNVDFAKAAYTDDLNLTINYCTVFEICKAEMAIPSKLIEHVGQRIFDGLKLKFPQLIYAKVCIVKLLPPMNGPVDKVIIEIEG